jgi:hypothetical protein
VRLVPAASEPSRDEMMASLTELITQTVPGDVVELLQSALDGPHTLQARADAALAEIANWWGTGKPGGRTLMAVNSILRGHVDAALAEQPLVQPLHWRTEDGGIAAVMCSRCNTLGGHDDDCPRRQPEAGA